MSDDPLALIERVVEDLGAGLVVLAPDGRAEHVSPRATSLTRLVAPGVHVDELRAGANDLLAAEIPYGDRTLVLISSRVPEVGVVLEQFATLSHEIRTPLNTMLGMAELLGAAQLGTAERRYTSILRGAAESLLQLINNLLDLQQLGAGRMELNDAPFYLHNVVDKALEGLALRAHNKGIDVSAQVDPDVPTYLVGDGGRLRQILTNLITNGVKFTETGGVNVEVHLHEAPAMLRFAVTDTGPGVPADKRDRLFLPYWQLHENAVEGSGLGLSISKRLAGAMGGDLWFEPREEGGSRFQFTARFQEQHAPERLTVSIVAQAIGLRVLILDDNEDVANAAAAMLTAWGPRPEIATEVDDALARMRAAAVEARPFELVFIDAELEPNGGFSVAKQIAATHPEAIIVMLLTSRELERSLRDAESLGLKSVIKPVQREELFLAVNRVHGAHTTRPPEDSLPPGGRILVVDDSAANRIFVEAVLRAQGHEVIAASSGAEALEHLSAGAFDLGIFDVRMPGMSGLELAQRVRAGDDDAQLPLLALTGDVLDAAVRACRSAGFDAHLGKPVSKAALIDAVRAHQRSASPRASAGVGDQSGAIAEARIALMRRDYDAVALVADRMTESPDAAVAQIARRLADAAAARDRQRLQGLVSALDEALKPAPVPAPAFEVDECILPMIPRYLRRRDDDLAAVRAALEEQDHERVAFLGHRMAGSGSTYGFPELTRIGKALEVAGNEESESSCRALVEDLAAFLAAVPSRLRE